jgi:hypothetical protein
LCNLWQVTSSRGPSSLVAGRLLPRRVREARNRDRTRFLIDDLNGAFFTLAKRRSTAASRAAAIERVRRMLSGTQWMSNVASDAWEYIEGGFDEASDAFGPAAVLLVVDAHNRRVSRWIATLSPSVRRALELSVGSRSFNSSTAAQDDHADTE